MIKNVLKKVLLVSVLVGSSLMAESSSKFDSSSLIGLEFGSGNIDVSSTGYDETFTSPHAAFKIGAETNNYRLFLSARYFTGSDFDALSTLGGEFQYLLNVADFMNFFIGLNAGVADIEFTDNANLSRVVSETYFGGDAGFNFHVGNSFDVELGARIMGIQAKHTLGGATYTFGNITSGYASIIYKYQMD